MFLQELKKIIQPAMLVVAILISLIFYKLEISFFYTMWPNGSLIESYQFAYQWKDEFGKKMQDEDFKQVAKETDKLIETADKQISASDFGKKHKLTNYQEFVSYRDSLPEGAVYDLNEKDKKERQLLFNFYQELNQNQLISKIEIAQQIQKSISYFKDEKGFFKQVKVKDETEKLRIKQAIFEEEDWRNILPEYLPSTVTSLMENILVLSLVLMVVLLPSHLVRDNILKVKTLQWSSKKGRKINYTQYISTMFAGFMIITISLVVFLAPILSTGYVRYFDSGLNSFFSVTDFDFIYSYLSITFGKWIGLLILLIYLIGMGFCSLLFTLSQTSKNYLSMTLKIIPLLTIFILVTVSIMKNAFYNQNFWYRSFGFFNGELYVAIFLFLVGILFAMRGLVKNQRQDLR